MSYTATVFSVMIASPSDVAAERSLIREVLAEWNVVHSRARRAVVLPIGWETHSSPEMGERPQEIINKKVLRNCDLLIAVFWTGIGTSTGEHESGTVEEIEEHIGAGKPVMLYFSSAPVVPESIDPEQYRRLTEFRKRCQARGLLETYTDLTDFRNKLYRQLQLKLNEEPFMAQLPSDVNGQSTSSVLDSGAPPMPQLIRESQVLLKAASADPNGVILYVHRIGGVVIQTNAKGFLDDSSDARTIANWESAISELEALGLIESAGPKREMFKVTRLGYEVADRLTP